MPVTRDARQGGALCAFNAFDDLGLHRNNDIFDHIGESSQCWDGRFSGENTNDGRLVEKYVKGDVEVVVCLAPGGNVKEFNLIFCSIPTTADFANTACNAASKQVGSWRDDSDRNEMAMGFDIACVVQSPERSIPSLVRLEVLKDITQDRGDIDKFPVQLVVNSSGVWRKREPGLGGLDSRPKADNAGVNRMVETVAKRPEDVAREKGQLDRHLPNQLDLVNIISRLRVELDDRGVWLRVEEGLNFDGKLVDVIARVCKKRVGVIEGRQQHAKASQE